MLWSRAWWKCNNTSSTRYPRKYISGLAISWMYHELTTPWLYHSGSFAQHSENCQNNSNTLIMRSNIIQNVTKGDKTDISSQLPNYQQPSAATSNAASQSTLTQQSNTVFKPTHSSNSSPHPEWSNQPECLHKSSGESGGHCHGYAQWSQDQASWGRAESMG